jgi:hypothetical protein
MIEINLIPNVKQELIEAQKVRAKVITGSVIISIVSVGIVSVLLFYVYGVQMVREGIADRAISSHSAKLFAVEDLSKILTIQNQLGQIDAIYDNKKVTSRLFDLLQNIIPPYPNDVQISNLNLDTVNRQITVEGQAANSYPAVEIFKKTIQGTNLEFKTDGIEELQSVVLADSVSTSSTSYGEDATGARVLRFTISFEYAPELFSPNSLDMKFKIVRDGNVTDSYLGVPKSIFVDRAQDLPLEEQ